MTKIGRGNANYWIEAVAEGGDDYYTKPGEAPGEWMGELAADLGLAGEVDRAEYAALLAGKHPKTGAILVNRPEPRTYVDAAGKKRRLEPILGYDIRFSAPKSVSLLWAIGSDEVQTAVLRAHEEAVREALSYLERHACFVRRGHGGTEIEPGTGFLSMSFLHRSSRSGDMALHSHVVTANMTRASSDGRWLSLASPKRQSPLLREAKPAGYVYQAALRANLTRELGLEWQAVVNGYADIAGIERTVIEHFSRRRAEIVEAMAERGATSAAAAEVAAYRTRPAKERDIESDMQRAEWRSRAAEFGLSEASIERLVRGSVAREPRPIGGKEIDGAIADLEATHSHFDRRDLLCALANRMREGADAAQLESSLKTLLASGRLVEIHHGEGPLAASYFTTPRLWQMEHRVLEVARQGEAAGAAVVDEPVLAAVLARHRYLSEEQVQMVRRLVTGGERIVTVAALPGTGKTTALTAAREAWAQGGIHGVGIATARSASGELADQAGIPATSTTAFLIRCEEAIAAGSEPLPPGAVVVMDEASAAPTPQFAAVVEVVEACGGKLVCIGDPRQIGAVGPGGIFGHLTNENTPIVLTEIRRQRDPLDRRIVELAHEGRGSDALDLLRTRDRLVIADTLPEALNALVLDWHESFLAGKDAVMIARRTRDVADLNERAREILAARQLLGETSVIVAGHEFALGDHVITRINSPEVSNRERWQVTGVDSTQEHLMLQRIGGDERSVVLSPRYLERRTESGEPAVQHAYALTTYATQSKTFDTSFALLDSGIAREDFVVAVSRARGETTAYGVAASDLLDPDLGPARREIDDPAHDLRAGSERIAAEYAAVEVSARKRTEALSAFELVGRREQLLTRLAQSAQPVAQEQLEMLDRRITETRANLAELVEKRDALLAGKHPDREEIALAESMERMSQEQLARLEAERESLAERTRAESQPQLGLSAPERAELALVEDRLLQLRRREVAAERLRPSEMIVGVLGPRPDDPAKAELWNEGVDLIYTYRQDQRLLSQGGDPLGPRRSDALRRRQKEAAELRLRRIQQALELEHARVIEGPAAEIVL